MNDQTTPATPATPTVQKCRQCGKPITTPVQMKITQRDNRSYKGIRSDIYTFCSNQCGHHFQMGCEG